MADCIFHLFLKVWDSEEKPEQWRSTTIIQIYKGKGDITEFSSYRNIHTKLEIPKLFGHILMSVAKPIIVDNMMKFQIGARPTRAQSTGTSLYSEKHHCFIHVSWLCNHYPVL